MLDVTDMIRKPGLSKISLTHIIRMLSLKTITLGDFKLEPPSYYLNPKEETLINGLLELFSLDEVTKFNSNCKLSTRDE
ncbi:MAG: hypothetical protein JWN76_1960, partial [Chitinophagaceae bacterium]|nr:hypothetical protein [Chitinophagaceae bacterium]